MASGLDVLYLFAIGRGHIRHGIIASLGLTRISSIVGLLPIGLLRILCPPDLPSGLGWALRFMAAPASPAPAKPKPARVYAFIDGNNLFNWAKRCFGYKYPNYDVKKLAESIVAMGKDRELVGVNFYVGIPKKVDDPKNHDWWMRKLAAMGKLGVRVTTRNLKRRELTIKLGGIVRFETTIPRLQEKGIDLKLGLDMVRLARNGDYDTAIVFSQDGDLVEAVEEVYDVAKKQNQRIQVECAYPIAPGIASWPIRRTTTTRQIDRATYDACIDPTDYRKLK